MRRGIVHSRRVLALAFVAVAWLSSVPAAPLPIRHVFVLLLENQSFERTFGEQSPAPYLARALPLQGALLVNYYGIGHASLDNYIALISGQAPNEATQMDCGVYTEFQLLQPALDANGQALGKGCVYPKLVRTLPGQLEGAGLSWKGYMEDMGKDPARDGPTCAHVAVGSKDRLLGATSGDQYATKHNPFIYFHSIIDDQARCDVHVVDLDRLPDDLQRIDSTPNYVFITPNLCDDGHDAPCVNKQPGGLISVNAFLQKWVPLVTGSAAFKKDGLLVITFDESDGEGPNGAAACCGELGLPGAAYPPGWTGPGGGRIGAVILSPLVKPGTVSMVPYNHYSLLRSIEDWFALDHLGYAAVDGLQPLGSDVFTNREPKASR